MELNSGVVGALAATICLLISAFMYLSRNRMERPQCPPSQQSETVPSPPERADSTIKPIEAPHKEAATSDQKIGDIRSRRLQRFQLSVPENIDSPIAEGKKDSTEKTDKSAEGSDSCNEVLKSDTSRRYQLPASDKNNTRIDDHLSTAENKKISSDLIDNPTFKSTPKSGRGPVSPSMGDTASVVTSEDSRLQDDTIGVDALVTNDRTGSTSNENKNLSEREKIEYVFGPNIQQVSCSTLTQILLREPITYHSLIAASGWWLRAVETSSISEWRDVITDSMKQFLEDRTPEEDLYTPNPTEEIASSLLELMGYKVSQISGKIQVFRNKSALPNDFIRALFSGNPQCASSTIELLLSCFRDYHLDTLLQDAFDMEVLNRIRNDRNIAAVVAIVLENESSEKASSAGSFQEHSALNSLLSISTIVPLSAIQFKGRNAPAPNGKFPQLNYFRDMPYSPKPTQLWCTNNSLLTRHSQMLTKNLNHLIGFLHALLEKGMKQNRKGITRWISCVIQLNHLFFSTGGRAALHADEFSSSESCSSGFILNISSVMLLLMKPIFQDPSKYVGMVDWEYTRVDNQIEFSKLTNMVSGSKCAAESLDSSEVEGKPFSFSTEIFWLTARVMELVDKIGNRRNEHLREGWNHYEKAAQIYKNSPNVQSEAVLEQMRLSLHTLHYGWAASHLDDPQFLSLACGWAEFCSSWLLNQASFADAPYRFIHFPAGLVKAMCDVWVLSAKACPEEAMPGLMAADAALFCVEFMNRPDLASSPVVQDRLLAVIDSFIMSRNNSLVGVVMNNQRIRESLAPAILTLYSKCHAVAALDVNEDVSFDKNSIRSKANSLLLHLYNYPLEEPRESIRAFVGCHGFEAFVLSAFDCIMYNYVEAVKTLAYHCKAEKRGLPPDSHAPRGVRWMLGLSISTFSLLKTLCDGESCVRQKMMQDELRDKVASFLFTCLNYVSSEAKLDALRVRDHGEWGFNEEVVVGHIVGLISSCLSVSDKVVQRSFVESFVNHPDFDSAETLGVVELPGGASLKHFLELFITVSQSCDSLKTKSEAEASNMLLSDTINVNAFAEAEVDAEDLYAAHWLSVNQVDSVEDGFGEDHYFKRIHASTTDLVDTASNLRAILRDYKRTASMLPVPHRDATIMIRYDEDSPSYCRAFVSGPIDTPYFCGAFIFDVYFPKDFPNVPPQVQFITTAGGTVRFHPNLYADGKVCVSLLGTYDGDVSERWDPKQSCLGQVLVSIQSLILGEYIPEAVNRHVTVDGRRISAEDYTEYRIMTVRHAIITLLKGFSDEGIYRGMFQELRPSILSYFISNRHRLLSGLNHEFTRLTSTECVIADKLMKEIVKLVEEFKKMEELLG